MAGVVAITKAMVAALRLQLKPGSLAGIEWDSEAFVKTFKRDYTRLVILPSGSGIIMRFSRTQG
jgi:hypothetical protein